MKNGFSSASSIFSNALLITSVGSSDAAIEAKYAKASLFSWYPAAIVVSTAFWSLDVSCTLRQYLFAILFCFGSLQMEVTAGLRYKNSAYQQFLPQTFSE